VLSVRDAVAAVPGVIRGRRHAACEADHLDDVDLRPAAAWSLPRDDVRDLVRDDSAVADGPEAAPHVERAVGVCRERVHRLGRRGRLRSS
jgi:hypothetical protein